MEIKSHFKENHDQLSKYNTLFHDYIRQNPQGLNQSSYGLLELNDPLFRLQPWPTFIGPKIKKEIIEANLNVLALLKNIPQRVFANDPQKISNYYGISMDLVKYFLYGVDKEHLDNLLARGDFIITANGIKCLEYNVNTNLGGMSLPLWESLYQATPIITEFINQNKIKIQNRNLYAFLYEHLAKAGIKFYHAYDEINTVVVMPESYNDIRRVAQERYLNAMYNTALQAVYPGLKGQIAMGTYPQLRVIGNDIFYNNREVHIIVEWCQGFVPQNILELFGKKKIMICNGAIAWLMSTKLNLALLSEHKDSDLFTPAEKETIEKHIPWTRKVSDTTTTFQGKKIHLKEFMLANREQLVLKPMVGAGG
ncbi:MAG: hypothetical protein MUF15_09615, partial [Acidobacteria bacterium]|nr:hypothetical protein [Acidobacteriota bacterium]